MLSYQFTFLKKKTMIKAKILKEVYLLNYLKANMLIENNLSKSRKFDIFISILSIYIDSCDVIILIFIKSRFAFQSTLIHFIELHIICYARKLIFLYTELHCLSAIICSNSQKQISQFIVI